MIKKFKFINLMPLVLAAVATVVILIACGHGSIEEIDSKKMSTALKNEELKMHDRVMSIAALPSSSSATKNSSGVEGSNSSSSASEGNSSGGSNTSSNSNTSGSSSSNLQSSSGVAPSSSSSVESPYNLTCEMTVNTGVAGTPIAAANRPKLKCQVKTTGVYFDVKDGDVDWTSNALKWNAPAVGTYDLIAKVDIEASRCQGLQVECGEFTVCPQTNPNCVSVPSSSSKPSSSSAAVASSSSAAVSSSSSRPSSSSVTPSSSSAPVSSSSSRPSSSSVTPSSSSAPPSSSSVAPSSSSITPSSSSVAPSSSSIAPSSSSVAACQYVPADCGDVAIGSVKTAAQNITSAQPPTGCYFATSATEILGSGLKKINGVVPADAANYCSDAGTWSKPKCSTELAKISKRDGGYYIYIDNYMNYFTTANTYEGLNPSCK